MQLIVTQELLLGLIQLRNFFKLNGTSSSATENVRSDK